MGTLASPHLLPGGQDKSLSGTVLQLLSLQREGAITGSLLPMEQIYSTQNEGRAAHLPLAGRSQRHNILT